MGSPRRGQRPRPGRPPCPPRRHRRGCGAPVRSSHGSGSSSAAPTTGLPCLVDVQRRPTRPTGLAIKPREGPQRARQANESGIVKMLAVGPPASTGRGHVHTLGPRGSPRTAELAAIILREGPDPRRDRRVEGREEARLPRWEAVPPEAVLREGCRAPESSPRASTRKLPLSMRSERNDRQEIGKDVSGRGDGPWPCARANPRHPPRRRSSARSAYSG